MPHFVNVSCANIYRRPTFHSEVDTQAVLWEQVSVFDHKNDFVEITGEDGYKGWINQRQIIERKAVDSDKLAIATQPFSFIYTEPDTESAHVRDVTAGGYLNVLSKRDGWLNVALPDEATGWIKEETFQAVPELSRQAIIDYAKKYTGVPYLWAGKTAKGLDCSGFVQTVHKIFGIKLRRDAHMQFDDARFVSDHPLQGQAGDLMFFAENGTKITHVGFVLGAGKILHARGMVRVNSLRRGDQDFDDSLLNDFVAIRSFLPENFFDS